MGKFIEEFWNKLSNTDDPNKCWEWQGYRNVRGYGCHNVNYKKWISHRYAYFMVFGEIPKDMYICHKCDNPPCCNPFHLFMGSSLDNARDRKRKGRNKSTVGESHYKTSLKKEDVLSIREQHANGFSRADIAKQYNITPGSVSAIVRRETWKHI